MSLEQLRLLENKIKEQKKEIEEQNRLLENKIKEQKKEIKEQKRKINEITKKYIKMNLGTGLETVLPTEMNKLFIMLVKADIECELVTFVVGGKATMAICSPSEENCRVDAVCHEFSNGGKAGLLEVLGSVNPDEPNYDVDGRLTAEEAFKYFKKRDYVPKHE